MKKLVGYNKNLNGGKRPHKKIQKFGKYKNLNSRFEAETKALNKYKIRVKQK